MDEGKGTTTTPSLPILLGTSMQSTTQQPMDVVDGSFLRSPAALPKDSAASHHEDKVDVKKPELKARDKPFDVKSTDSNMTVTQAEDVQILERKAQVKIGAIGWYENDFKNIWQ